MPPYGLVHSINPDVKRIINLTKYYELILISSAFQPYGIADEEQGVSSVQGGTDDQRFGGLRPRRSILSARTGEGRYQEGPRRPRS